MKKYSFEKSGVVYVLGDCQGEFKSLFHNIKSRLVVKDEDVDAPHPKEIERQARRRALEEAMRNQPLPEGHGRPFTYEDFRRRARAMTYTFADSNTISKKSSKMSRSPYDGAIFIVAGDCGLGFYKPKYYDDLFSKFNKVLAYNNATILFVRGNHDDPAYFDGETINYSNIKAIPDYSVVMTGVGNILCVGGAISIDRTWRMEQEGRINRFSPSFKRVLYWKDEAPVFDEEKIKEIAKECGKIDYVVSHTAPSFAEPNTHVGLDDWAENDPKLIEDVRNERIVMDKIFESLRENGIKPSYWAYGHFDYGNIEKRSDTIFRALHDGYNPTDIFADVMSFNQMEAERKKKSKKKISATNITESLNEGEADGMRLEEPGDNGHGRYFVRHDEGRPYIVERNEEFAPVDPGHQDMDEAIEEVLDDAYDEADAPGQNGPNPEALHGPNPEALHGVEDDGVTIEIGQPADAVTINPDAIGNIAGHGADGTNAYRTNYYHQLMEEARRINEATLAGNRILRNAATGTQRIGADWYNDLLFADAETTNGGTNNAGH